MATLEIDQGSRFRFKPVITAAWPRLLENSLHVWTISLDQPEWWLESASGQLSPDELRRAEKFRFSQHATRFLVGRVSLRNILARYLNFAPEELEFSYTNAGKPELIFPMETGIHFNLSHSADVGLLAVARTEVGADIEHSRPIPEHLQIARCFFSEVETAELLSVPEPERQDAFYRCWTRKEALLKGWGCGITENLKAFEVSLATGESPLLRRCRPNLRANWRIHHLEPAAQFIGAVAVNSSSSEPECFHFLSL